MSVLTLPTGGQQRAIQARRRLALKAAIQAMLRSEQHLAACERMHLAAAPSS